MTWGKTQLLHLTPSPSCSKLTRSDRTASQGFRCSAGGGSGVRKKKHKSWNLNTETLVFVIWNFNCTVELPKGFCPCQWIAECYQISSIRLPSEIQFDNFMLYPGQYRQYLQHIATSHIFPPINIGRATAQYFRLEFPLVKITNERIWTYIANLLPTCLILPFCLRPQLLLLDDLLSNKSSESPLKAPEPAR